MGVSGSNRLHPAIYSFRLLRTPDPVLKGAVVSKAYAHSCVELSLSNPVSGLVSGGNRGCFSNAQLRGPVRAEIRIEPAFLPGPSVGVSACYTRRDWLLCCC